MNAPESRRSWSPVIVYILCFLVGWMLATNAHQDARLERLERNAGLAEITEKEFKEMRTEPKK